MDFKEATDVLTSAPTMTLAKVAEAFGKDTHTIMRARMEGPNARRPPQQWEAVVADLALEHAKRLHVFSEQLEELAANLKRSS